MNMIRISFTLNGDKVTKEIEPNKRAVDALREDFGMLSVKEGCGEGECGACTVIMDGETVTTCCMLAGQLDGHDITTVEGLSKDGIPHPIQEAFVEMGAVQCGFCTPAMVLSAKALLDKNPHPTREEIKMALSGNLCRCTGYSKIEQAVELAAGKLG